jgi:hypothetical protein
MLFSTIVEDAVREVFTSPELYALPVDQRDLALRIANSLAEEIWSAWEWDNEKMDEFTDSPDADGIIVLPATVESVQAVALNSADSSVDTATPIWNADQRRDWANGHPLPSETFHHLAADSDLTRRIRVAKPEGTTVVYRFLAVAKYVRATVEAAYSPANPSATPTDYRVLHWLIDRATPSLCSALRDRLRAPRGIPLERRSSKLMKDALARELIASDRQIRTDPRYPQYGDLGPEGAYDED